MPTSGGPQRPSGASRARSRYAVALRLLAVATAVLLGALATGAGTAFAKPLVVMQKEENGNRSTMSSSLYIASIEGVYSTHHMMSTLLVDMEVPELKGGSLRIPITVSYKAFAMAEVTDESFSVRDEDGKEYPVKNEFETFKAAESDYEPEGSAAKEIELVVPDAPEHGSLQFNGHAMEQALPDVSVCYSAGDLYHPDQSSCYGGIRSSEEDFHPKKCTLSNLKFGLGFGATVVATAGRDFVLSRERFSDGTASVTFLSKSSIAVETGLGAELKANLGKQFEASARIPIGAGISVENGSTWLFDDVGSAKRLERLITSIDKVSNSTGSNPLSGRLAEELARPAGAIMRPHVVREGVNVDVNGGFDLGVGLRDPNEAAQGGADPDADHANWITERVGAKGVAKVERGVAIVRNRKDRTTTHVYTLGGSAEVNSQGVVNAPVASKKQTGTLKLTFDRKNRVTGVDLSHLHSVKGGVRETATSLKVESNAERRVVKDWLAVSSKLGALPVVWDEVVVTDPSQEMNAFDKLLYEKGVVLRTTHKTGQGKVSLSAQIKVLVSMGLAGHITKTTESMTKTEYLQGPLPFSGERQYGTYQGCH